MSKIQVKEFPNWTFDIDETSAGVYKVVARHRLGPSIEQSGFNPDELLEQVKREAQKMDKSIEDEMK